MFERSHVGSAHWERQTIQKVLLEHITEQRRARRWSIFFKLVTLSIFIFFMYWIFSSSSNKDITTPVLTKAHTALIDVHGEISVDQEASASRIRSALKSAFENRNVKAVVLRINSPGGSPVQARQVFNEILYLKSKYPGIKVYSAIEDVGASAAYLIAAASDAIYADKTSLVGSIGVRMDSFGFVDAMQKVGVERRLYAAGKHKTILDPFSPRNPEDDAFIKQQLDELHQIFIANVRQGRGNRLKDNPEIFSGLFWIGEDALKLGLIDGYGDAQYIAREIVKAEDLVDYTPATGILDKLTTRLGASVTKTLLTTHFLRLF